MVAPDENLEPIFSANKDGEDVDISDDRYSLDEAIDHMGFGYFQVKIVLIAGCAWMADAMELMVLSILAPALMCEWNLTSYQEAMITTVVFLGNCFGAWSWGYISDRFGRKTGLYCSTSIMLVFGILSSQSPSYVWMLLFRFLVGFGMGGAPQAVTIVTEMLPTSTRGSCIVLLELFWAIGSLFAAGLGMLSMQHLTWRWYLILVCIPVLCFLFTGVCLPESPRYLLVSGKYDTVTEILENISRANNAPLPRGSLKNIKGEPRKGRITDLVSRNWRCLTALLLTVWFISAFTYYGIVLLTTEIFQTGISGCNPNSGAKLNDMECRTLSRKDYIDVIWTTIGELPGIIFVGILVEILGRKRTLAVSYSLTALAFVLLYFCTNRTAEVAFIFMARAFATGSIIGIHVYTPEVLPTSIRSFGFGACSSFARIGAMVTPFVAQVLILTSFYAVLTVYASLLILCVFISIALPIETKGRALVETTYDAVPVEKSDEQE